MSDNNIITSKIQNKDSVTAVVDSVSLLSFSGWKPEPALTGVWFNAVTLTGYTIESSGYSRTLSVRLTTGTVDVESHCGSSRTILTQKGYYCEIKPPSIPILQASGKYIIKDSMLILLSTSNVIEKIFYRSKISAKVSIPIVSEFMFKIEQNIVPSDQVAHNITAVATYNVARSRLSIQSINRMYYLDFQINLFQGKVGKYTLVAP